MAGASAAAQLITAGRPLSVLIIGVLLLGGLLWSGMPYMVGRRLAQQQRLWPAARPETMAAALAANRSGHSQSSSKSAPDWAFLGPQSGCTIAHDGTVSPRAVPLRSKTSLPFLLDAAAMPDPWVTCANCTGGTCVVPSRPNGSTPCLHGVCVFTNSQLKRSLCSRYHPDGPSPEAVLGRLPPAQQAALRALSPCELYARLRGRTLFLVGDSLTLQLYDAIECFLREFAPSLCRSNLTNDPALVEALSEGTLRGRAPPRCLVLQNDTRVCGVRQYTPNLMQSKALPALRMLRGDKLKSDLMVHNFGLHLTRGPYRQNLASLAQYIQANAAWLPATVWLDTSPQHFRTPDGSWGGQGSPNGCVPFTNASLFQATAVGYNRLVAGLEPQLGAVHLRTWAPSAAMWDQHMGSDCTHWCHPGVPEVWLALLNSALAEKGLGNAVRLVAR